MDLFGTENTNHHHQKMQRGYQMAIQPIDLQTLYSQMDKVSKNVVQQQQHVQLHNSMELDGLVKKDIQKNEKIEKTSEKEGMAEIKDGQSSKNSGQNPSNKNEKEEVPSEVVLEIIKDPSLGKTIDISG